MVREWIIKASIDAAVFQASNDLPKNIKIEESRPANAEMVNAVLIVREHRLTDAIDLVVAAFGGRANPPLVASGHLRRP
jgi:hypothetical protein